jgi:phospholipid transport system substrate-binding protein
MINSWISRLLGVLLLLAVHAPLLATTATDPQEIVKQTTERVLQKLRSEGALLKKDQQRLYQVINEVILPHFDFRQMSKWVLGRYWRSASEPQRSQFTKQFELLLVKTYSNALVEFRDETVDFLPSQERSGNEVAVRSTINRTAGPAVLITYQMHKVDNSWKVYDVVVEGVSLVINYRSSFAQEINRNGLDGLIQRLVDKNAAGRG